MKPALLIAAAMLALAVAPAAQATGLTTCNSGPKSGWQSQDTLKTKLTGEGWKVRRIKVDGGCYEVYAINDNGERVEAYFHPVTFKHVLTSRR
ncbi:MAG TPA: PepSY domain-containing protein [Alphaproteobacteria bacterium]|nr:PepSY domain-containing protein [Alphaproteobacteria bacterium]